MNGKKRRRSSYNLIYLFLFPLFYNHIQMNGKKRLHSDSPKMVKKEIKIKIKKMNKIKSLRVLTGGELRQTKVLFVCLPNRNSC